MIDAFKSTLEESLAADLILLLIDASEGIREISIKYAACKSVVEELKADGSKVLVVFTKYDSLANPEEEMKQIAENLGISNPVAISSKSGYGIRKLGTMLSQHPYVVSASK